MKKYIWLCIIVLFWTPGATAQVYQWVDGNGVKHFSNTPVNRPKAYKEVPGTREPTPKEKAQAKMAKEKEMLEAARIKNELIAAVEIPQTVAEAIMARAIYEHPDDFSMQQEIIKKENRAYRKIQVFSADDLPFDVVDGIITKASTDHPGGYLMQLNLIEKEIKAYRQLIENPGYSSSLQAFKEYPEDHGFQKPVRDPLSSEKKNDKPEFIENRKKYP